jgi:hypothetical protein
MTSEIQKITCSVCIDELIAPVTLPCGHTICYTCNSQLLKRLCPECRAEIPKTCHISLLLDTVLSSIIDNYNLKKKSKLLQAERDSLIKKYSSSTRYYSLLSYIDLYLEVEGHATLETLLLICKRQNTSSFEPIADEILFILNNISSLENRDQDGILPITIDNETYFIDYENPGNLRRFASLFKHKLSANDIYTMISVFDNSNVAELFNSLNINTNFNIKYDSNVLSSHISKLALVECLDSDEDEDDEDESSQDREPSADVINVVDAYFF